MTYPVLLAIDFGTVRIGLAISRGTLAEPLDIIPSDDQAISTIKELCDQERVEKIIVGISENEMAEKTKEFVKTLQTQVKLPLELVDETLSSHAVHQKQLESGLKLAKRKQPIDHLAAAEVLQEYLDTSSH